MKFSLVQIILYYMVHKLGLKVLNLRVKYNTRNASKNPGSLKFNSFLLPERLRERVRERVRDRDRETDRDLDLD